MPLLAQGQLSLGLLKGGFIRRQGTCLTDIITQIAPAEGCQAQIVALAEIMIFSALIPLRLCFIQIRAKLKLG